MNNLLEDFVSDESLEIGASSYYHVSGMHICQLQGSYVVLSHNEYRDLKDKTKTLEDLDPIKCQTLEEAVEEVRNIVEYANSRGAVDARFVQRKRGSDYKVNSQSQDSNQATKKYSSFSIGKVLSLEISDHAHEKNNKLEDTNTSILHVKTGRRRDQHLRKKIKKALKKALKKQTYKKVRKKFKKLVLKISEKSSQINLNPLFRGRSKPSESTFNTLISYQKKGYKNYYIAEKIDENIEKRVISVELVNDSVATNELVATIKNFNLVKLNQHLYVPIKQGLPLGERELENGEHLLNHDLVSFTTERAAIRYIFERIDDVKERAKKQEAIFKDSVKLIDDYNIHYDIFYINSKYLAIPSIYTINIDELVMLDDSELMEKYKFCAFSDDFDFLKVALQERGDWMDEWPYNDDEICVYQDEFCILAKDIAENKVYDLTKVSSSNLSQCIKTKISGCIFRDLGVRSMLLESEKKLVSRIGSMCIMEFEGYYFAIKDLFVDEFPNNQYLDDVTTRYDVSISVIEQYCKELLVND